MPTGSYRNTRYTEEELRQAAAAYEEHGSYRKAAKALGLTLRTYGRRLDRAIQQGMHPKNKPAGKLDASKGEVEDAESGNERVISGKNVTSLEELIAAADVDLSEWIVTKKVINKWDSVTKEGPRALWQVKAWLEKRPDWFVKPIKAVKPVKRVKAKSVPATATALIIPDSQHGYRRRADGSLEPLHDRLACDLALQAAKVLQPQTVVLLGDMLDLAPWSTRYTTSPSLRYTTQPALVELHWWLSSIRKAAPSAEIIYLEGNHENRILRAITEKIDEAVGLSPADDPAGPGVLSIERLLGLADLDIEYVGPYGSSWWLWEKVQLHHGSLVRSKGGQTTTAMLANSAHSQVVGHIHRREYSCKTIDSLTGSRTITAMSPGCLCRVDGAVPHAGGSTVLDWQQGLGVVYRHKEDISVQVTPIDEGGMFLHGKYYRGVDRTPELRKATGLPY